MWRFLFERTNFPVRTYSTSYAGKRFFPSEKIVLKQAEGDSHLLVVHTSCSKAGCLQLNCAQPNVLCERMAYQNQSLIPQSGGNADFKTNVVGNTTHKPPANLDVVLINKKFDYSDRFKEQSLVVEDATPEINPNEFKINKGATRYIQKTENHNALMHTKISSSGKTIAEKLAIIRK